MAVIDKSRIIEAIQQTADERLFVCCQTVVAD